MDSTFIGLLIGIDKILKKSQKKTLDIIHVSQSLLNLLKEVQVSQILNISKEISHKDDNKKYETIYIEKNLSTESSDILEAHQNLSEISEKNRRKFALLTKILSKTCSED